MCFNQTAALLINPIHSQLLEIKNQLQQSHLRF